MASNNPEAGTTVDNPYLHSRRKRALDRAVSGVAMGFLEQTEHTVARYLGVSPDDIYVEQERLAPNGQTYTMRKIRTHAAVDDVHRASDPMRFAAKLDKASLKVMLLGLDDIPQIRDVHEGRLSLVGPRPMPAAYYDRIGNIVGEDFFNDWLGHMAAAKPGLMSPSTTSFRGNPSYFSPETTVARMQMDIEYAQRATLRTDMELLGSLVGLAGRLGAISMPPEAEPVPILGG